MTTTIGNPLADDGFEVVSLDIFLKLVGNLQLPHTLPTKLRIKKEGLETLFFISKGETRTLDLSGMSRTL